MGQGLGKNSATLPWLLELKNIKRMNVLTALQHQPRHTHVEPEKAQGNVTFSLSPYVANLPTLAKAHSSAIRKILDEAKEAEVYCEKRLGEN